MHSGGPVVRSVLLESQPCLRGGRFAGQGSRRVARTTEATSRSRTGAERIARITALKALILFWRWRGQQIHKQFVEPLRVQINLHFGGLKARRRLLLVRPGQRVSVAGAAV